LLATSCYSTNLKSPIFPAVRISEAEAFRWQLITEGADYRGVGGRYLATPTDYGRDIETRGRGVSGTEEDKTSSHLLTAPLAKAAKNSKRNRRKGGK